MTKRIIPVIHIVNTKQVFQNIDTCLSLGVNNVFLINHLTDTNDLLDTAELVKQKYPDLWIGLNFLGLAPHTTLEMDLPYDALWIDNTLNLSDVENKRFNGEIFSGLNFKYQKQYYGDSLKDIVDTIKKTSTVACTSGAGTGIAASTQKIEELKELLGSFPLGLASGVSVDNIEAYLPYVDNFLVASSITDRNEIIQYDLLKALVEKI